MRSLFLTLVLANILTLVWQLWVAPEQELPAPEESGRLVLFQPSDRAAPAPDPASGAAVTAPVPIEGGEPSPDGPDTCLRIGPLPTAAAARQARDRLGTQGIAAVVITRDTQVWLGNWVQITGFGSMPEAEAARQRLVAGGLADAYLMQDGPQPTISLGVFRDRRGADRVAATARELGFSVQVRDRYRPAVAQWLLVRAPPGTAVPAPGDLGLADDRILRSEPIACEPGAPPPGSPPPADSPGGALPPSL